jgi:hypothetical protein
MVWKTQTIMSGFCTGCCSLKSTEILLNLSICGTIIAFRSKEEPIAPLSTCTGLICWLWVNEETAQFHLRSLRCSHPRMWRHSELTGQGYMMQKLDNLIRPTTLGLKAPCPGTVTPGSKYLNHVVDKSLEWNLVNVVKWMHNAIELNKLILVLV